MTTHALLEELRDRKVRAVVIGGSAGGIEALRALSAKFSAQISVPVLVVLHVAAESNANWSVVFRDSALAVQEAEDGDMAEPARLYLAPPDYHLLVDAALRLSLSVEAPVNLSRPSIDVLFESAAWACGRSLLAIVLSGANADGAAGLAAIRDAGGLCWIQAPETAPAPSMPRAALASVPNARVLTLKEMTEVLHAFHG
jgi:two-component system, chemotaxis family, protein-glutamate methylesterase/glutaminase